MLVQGKGLLLDELGWMVVEVGYFFELMGEVQGLNDGVVVDFGVVLLEVLCDEVSGNVCYFEGDGLDFGRVVLNGVLQECGIDLVEMLNDEIVVVLEGGCEFGQLVFDKGGCVVEVWCNGDRVL